MKVVFAWVPQPICGTSVIQQGFFDSFFGFAQHDARARQVFGGYTFASTGYIPSSRNTIVDIFLTKTTGDYLLMLDWDVTFAPEDVYKLIDAASETKIVSGCYVTYFGADNALRPCWMEQVGDQACVPVTTFDPDKIVPLTVCGMGFTLFHRAALEKIGEANKGDPWAWFGHDVINASRVGEDVTFCSRARKCGLTIWGHGGVQLGHTKAKTLTPTDMLDRAFSTSSAPPMPGSVLNVGAGQSPLPPEYSGLQNKRLDCDPAASPDVLADGRDLSVLADESEETILCSHNLEHYFEHEVPGVLAGFRRVLKPGGKLDVRVPDLKAVMREAGNGLDLTDVLYQSPAGPIRAHDVIFGYGREIERSGKPFYAHKTGFTAKSLRRALGSAGFKKVKIQQENYELRALATK